MLLCAWLLTALLAVFERHAPQGMLRAIFPSAVVPGAAGGGGGTHAHDGGHGRGGAGGATATATPAAGPGGAPATSLQVGVISAVGTAVLAASVGIYSRLCWSEAEDLTPKCDYGKTWRMLSATSSTRVSSPRALS